MVSADVDIQQTDCEGEANAAGTTANLLMKVLRSVDRNTTGPISDEALSVSSSILSTLIAFEKELAIRLSEIHRDQLQQTIETCLNGVKNLMKLFGCKYASALLAELTEEMKLLGFDKENAKAQRNLGKVHEFATTEIMKLERRLRTKKRERKNSLSGEGHQRGPSIGNESV